MIISCTGKVERSDSTDRNLLYLKKKKSEKFVYNFNEQKLQFFDFVFQF